VKISNLQNLTFYLSFSISIGACSFFEPTGKNREKGMTIASTKAAIDSLMADKETNDGKRFTVIGYLYYTPGFTVYTNRPQTIYIRTESGMTKENIASVDAHWAKDGHNSVFVPAEAGREVENTIFYDHEAKPFTFTDKVSISFTVSKTSVFLTEPRFDKVQ
jgi:hypothetical protein